MQDFLSDFGQFVWELVNRWPDIAVGGFLGFLWLGFEKIRDKPISLKTFFTILGVSLFFATFGAWREQYRKVKESQRLHGYFNGPIMGGVTPDGDTSVLVPFGVMNGGAPTTPWGFSATVKMGKEVQNLQTLYLPENVVFDFDGRGSAKIAKSDMLIERLITPIPQGGHTDGYLFYVAKGVSAAKFNKMDTEITIHFKDTSNNEYQFTGKLGLKTTSPVYVPGMNNTLAPFMEESTRPSSTPSTGASPP